MLAYLLDFTIYFTNLYYGLKNVWVTNYLCLPIEVITAKGFEKHCQNLRFLNQGNQVVLFRLYIHRQLIMEMTWERVHQVQYSQFIDGEIDLARRRSFLELFGRRLCGREFTTVWAGTGTWVVTLQIWRCGF